MELWTEIRRRVLVDGVSKRAVCREYGMGWETLEEVVTRVEPSGCRLTHPRAKPKLGAFLGVIDEILAADRDASPKQRHTAKRIFERLRDEWGYAGGESQVRAAVAEATRYSREVFVPLSRGVRRSSISVKRPWRSAGSEPRRRSR